MKGRAPKEPNPLVERAWEALDEGFPERALQLLERLDGDSGEARLARAMACLELGDLAAAEEHVAAARRDPELDDESRPLADWVAGEVALRAGRFEDARDDFEASLAGDRAGTTCDRLALCADLLGDADASARWSSEAHRLDPDAFPPPLRLDADAFGDLVRSAAAALPPVFRDALDEAELVVEDVPARELVTAGLPPGDGPDLLGLFEGLSRLEVDVEASGVLPPRIHLFQRNLERVARDARELELEIRVTLYHELAHLLGFDEDGVEAMGLE